MTLPYKKSRKVVVNTGAVTSIAVDFTAEASQYVKVYAGLPGTALMVQGVDYTLTGVTPGSSSFTVNILNPGDWGDFDVFAVSVEYTVEQPSDVDVGGPFGARFEAALDRLALIMQSLEDRVNRSLKMPVTGTVGQDNSITAYPNQLIGWNEDGTELIGVPTSSQSAQDALAAAALAAASADEADDAADDAAGFAGAASASAVLSGAKALLSKLYAEQFQGQAVESATNQHLYSEQFDNAIWTKTSVAVVANATVAPDGTTTADRIVKSVAATAAYVNQTRTPTVVGVPCVYSVFAKADAMTQLQLYMPAGNFGSQTQLALFDLITGAVVLTSGGASGYTEDWGGGWFRCVLVTVPMVTSAASTVRAYPAGSGTPNLPVGDGTSGIYLWGAQFEQGTVAGPYVPTTTTSLAGAYYSAKHWALTAAATVANAVQATLNAAAAKASMVDADVFAILDSAASNAIKKVTWLAVKLGVFVQPAVALARAATTDLGAAASFFLSLTGTTTITSLGTAAAGTLRLVQFAGIGTLTNNANIILPTAANITTAANDFALFRSEGAGVWRCVWYRGALVTADWTTGTNTTPGMPTPAQITAQIAAKASSDVKAWITFDGTGTPVINGSRNVTSVTDNGTGDYTINFTTAMANVNYAVIGGTNSNAATHNVGVAVKSTGTPPTNSPQTKTTTACRVQVGISSGGVIDVPDIYIAFLGA